MIFRPGWPHRCPRTLKDLVGARTEHADRLTHDMLRVIGVDVPATSVCELGEHLAIHDRVGAGLVRGATLDGDVIREPGGPHSERDRHDRRGQRTRDLVERSRRRPYDRRAHLRYQRRRRSDIEALALIVNRCRGCAGLDQLDPPTVHDLMVRRRRHSYGPPEMIGNTHAHVTKYPCCRGRIDSGKCGRASVGRRG